MIKKHFTRKVFHKNSCILATHWPQWANSPKQMTYDQFKQRYRYDPANDLLGEGAFGKVFRAIDTETGSTVAIKVAPVNTSNESHSLKHEFETVGKVEPHLNIALYDECYRFSVEWAGLHDFAILEYYPLGSLDKLIKSQTLTDTEKVDLGIGILEGLRHLHNTGAQGVVHRDLKPRNVLIQKWRGKLVPKITDFGLSKFSDSVSNSVISQSFKGGTLNYASPEQIKGEQIRKNTDLWSFGVILHEILTGEVPYKIDDSSESTLRHVYARMNQQSLPETFKKVKEPFATIIKKCLVVNPNQRYRTAEEVLKDFKSITPTAAAVSTPFTEPSIPTTPPAIKPSVPVESVKPPMPKDNTEIWENPPFESFNKKTETPLPDATNISDIKTQKEDPKNNDELASPKKNYGVFAAIGGVALLAIITFVVLFKESDSTEKLVTVPDSSEAAVATTKEITIDTTSLARQADSLFVEPKYEEYARIILQINEAVPSIQGTHSKAAALVKLKKKAASWEQYSIKDPEVHSFLEAFKNAILLLDPTDAKGKELEEKLK